MVDGVFAVNLNDFFRSFFANSFEMATRKIGNQAIRGGLAPLVAADLELLAVLGVRDQAPRKVVILPLNQLSHGPRHDNLRLFVVAVGLVNLKEKDLVKIAGIFKDNPLNRPCKVRFFCHHVPISISKKSPRFGAASFLCMPIRHLS